MEISLIGLMDFCRQQIHADMSKKRKQIDILNIPVIYLELGLIMNLFHYTCAVFVPLIYSTTVLW